MSSRLQQRWPEALTLWPGRRLQGTREVSVRVDGVYGATRLDDTRPCILVLRGAAPVAPRRGEDSGMATASVSSPGKPSGSTSKVVAWRTGQPWPGAMGRWGFGKRSATCTARRVGNEVCLAL